jgi:hypothetical protein
MISIRFFGRRAVAAEVTTSASGPAAPLVVVAVAAAEVLTDRS